MILPTESSKDVYVKVIDNRFGGCLVTPVCDNAHHFAGIAKSEVLDEKQLFLIERLGFNLVKTYSNKD